MAAEAAKLQPEADVDASPKRQTAFIEPSHDCGTLRVMTDTYLVLELVGLIAISAVVVYFLSGRNLRHASIGDSCATEPAARARARR